MFSLFEQNPTNVSYTFKMWLTANRTSREVPVRFQFMKSETVGCSGRQIVELKVSSATLIEIILVKSFCCALALEPIAVTFLPYQFNLWTNVCWGEWLTSVKASGSTQFSMIHPSGLKGAVCSSRSLLFCIYCCSLFDFTFVDAVSKCLANTLFGNMHCDMIWANFRNLSSTFYWKSCKWTVFEQKTLFTMLLHVFNINSGYFGHFNFCAVPLCTFYLYTVYIVQYTILFMSWYNALIVTTYHDDEVFSVKVMKWNILLFTG